MRALKKIMAALALTAVLAGCSGGGVLSSLKGGSTSAQSISRPAVESAELQFAHPAAGDTIAVFDTSAGIFKAVLFPDEAPQAVQNFTTLAGQGFYNGLTVTRVEKDFVVEAGQGADGRGTTIWNGSRYPAETTDKLHHYSGDRRRLAGRGHQRLPDGGRRTLSRLHRYRLRAGVRGDGRGGRHRPDRRG